MNRKGFTEEKISKLDVKEWVEVFSRKIIGTNMLYVNPWTDAMLCDNGIKKWDKSFVQGQLRKLYSETWADFWEWVDLTVYKKREETSR
jgi:hypothetical protein